MRVGNHSAVNYDYHYMLQVNNGSWADKHGNFAIQNNVPVFTNPSTFNWALPIVNSSGTVTAWQANYYNSATIYFASTWN
jgi:hypothetical protein